MAYEASCSQDDSFMIRSEDEDEVVDALKQHARQKHDSDLSDDDARGMIQET